MIEEKENKGGDSRDYVLGNTLFGHSVVLASAEPETGTEDFCCYFPPPLGDGHTVYA